mgnify:CR=1 FL=1
MQTNGAVMLVKTVTFTIMHITIAFLVASALTGSFVIGGALALIEPLCNSFGYHIHEKVWRYFEKNKAQASETDGAAVIKARI